MSGDFTTLFVDTQKRDISRDPVLNLASMKFSYNFSFDDESDFDQAATDTGIAVANGKLILDSGSSGYFVSLNKATTDDVSSVQVKARGEDLENATFEVSADNGNTWQAVTLEEVTSILNQGNGLRLRIRLLANSARIEAAVVLYR